MDGRAVIGNLLRATLFFAVTIAVTWLIYVVFFSSPPDEKRYWYWDATIIFVWYDAPDSEVDYVLGKGRYKVLLPNGRQEAARSFLDESFQMWDCVRVREHLSMLPPPVPFEIIGRAENCYQPDGPK